MSGVSSRKATYVILIASLIEAVTILIVIFLITPDPKNNFFFGYSLNRLLLGVITLLAIILPVYVLLKPRFFEVLENWFLSESFAKKIIRFLALPVLLFFILTLLLPAYRFGVYSARFIRIQPIMILFELWFLQIYFIDRYLLGKIQKLLIARISKKRIAAFVVVGFLLIISYYILRLFTPDLDDLNLVFASGIPITGFQVFLAWMIFLGLFLVDGKYRIFDKLSKKWVMVVFILIWIATTIIWSNTPIVCTNDRPGPYLPNNLCYPQINDAVYSIGSHYTALGQGINNHWLTDKPFYMIILAIGQWIFGQDIDSYLYIQIIIIALIPAIMFLFGRKYFGFAQGLFLAILLSMQGENAIKLYQFVDSVNVKVENTELLTSLLLVLLLPSLFLWLKYPVRKEGPILTGGLLGIAVLTRFTPFFIIPLIILVVWVVHRKSWKTFFLNLSLFTITFSLVFVPWLFSANDRNGDNFYAIKFVNVISTRFGFRFDSDHIQETITPTGSTPNATSEITQLPSAPPVPHTKNLSTAIINTGTGIFLSFLNNQLGAIAQLPTRILFYDLQTQIQDPIRQSNRFFWKYQLTFENGFAILVSLLVYIIGLTAAWKRFGVAGLSALIIQCGYFLGNTISHTSGGRYLEPVFWTVLLYYTIGLVTITIKFLRFFTFELPKAEIIRNRSNSKVEKLDENNGTKGSKILIFFVPFLLVGLSIPLINNFKLPFPNETNPENKNIAFQYLETEDLVSENEWAEFLNDPRSIVVEGVALNPRSYRNSFFLPGNLMFEMMVLAKDHIYISYSEGITPQEYFSDGSQVILVGCILAEDNYWYMNRVIIYSSLIIQTDYEGQILHPKNFDLICYQGEQ
jgi:4-amino-4-deoxy-L-arabinose transferase-like glycosyltransferase